MSVCSVDYYCIYASFHQCFHAVQCVGGYSYTGSHTQTSLFIFASHWFVLSLCDVFVSDQADELVVVVYNRKFLNFVFLQNLCCCNQVGLDVCGNQTFAGHHFIYGTVDVLLKAQISVSDNSDQVVLVINYGYTSNVIFAHEGQSVLNFASTLDGYGVVNHTVFSTFYNCNLASLFLNSHILVDNTDSSFTRNGDGHIGFGHRVHCSGNKWNLEFDVTREFRCQLYRTG